MSEKILLYIACFICSVTVVYCYKQLTFKGKINHIKTIFLIFIASYFTFLTNAYIYNAFKILINSIVFISLNYFIFKENIKLTIIKTIMIYIIVIITEILLTIFTYFLDISSFQEYNKIYVFKTLFSILNMLVVLLIFKIRPINNFFKRLISAIYKSRNKIFRIAIIILYIVTVILAFRGTINRSNIDYLINVILTIAFFLFIMLVFYQSYKTKIAEKREETLLNFMKKYETLIEKDRIRRHEILNNLLILKSSYNKKELNFEEILNDVILQYENKEKSNYTHIYKMPSGLKGILYYKLNDMENSKININLNVSKNIVKELDNMDNDLFLDVSKILGILLDNARESAEKTENKEVIVDFYKENSGNVIYIENSCENKIDFSKINIKGYSSKGKNRGYGLYIVNKIVNNNPNLLFEQYFDNGKFISKLIIK